MSKVLKFRAIHRILVNNLMDGKGNEGGTLTDLNHMLEVIKKLGITDEEKEKIKLKILEGGAVTWNFKDEDGTEVDVEKDFEIADRQVELIKEALANKSEKKEIKFADLNAYTQIAEQVGFEL